MTKELDKVPHIVTKLKKKPYDCTMTVTWLEKETSTQTDASVRLVDLWITGKSLLDDLWEDISMSKADKLSKLREKTDEIKDAKKEIEQSYDRYKLTVIGEFSKAK